MNDFSSGFRFVKYEMNTYRFNDKTGDINRNYLAYVIEGRAEFKLTNGTVLNINSGEAFFLPLNCTYCSYWYGNPKISFYSLGFLSFPLDAGEAVPAQKITVTDKILQLFQTIELKNPPGCEAIGNFYLLLNEFLKQLKRETKYPRLLYEVEEAVLKNPDATIKDIASELSVSERKIYHVFEQTGMETPTEFKQRVLINKAAELLQTTDLPIEEISWRLGFSSPSYFRKIFKKYHTESPREFRKMHAM